MVLTFSALLASVPSIGQWVVGITTTFIGIALKQQLDERCKDLELERIKAGISASYFTEASDPPILLSDEHFVRNENAVSKLLTILTDKPCCLLVVGAPAGSGKTSYIGEAMKQFLAKKNGRRLHYFASGLVDLHDFWKIPRHAPLAQFIPQDSVLVFDQVDDRELSSIKKDWIVTLATQARNSGKFHVVLLVSCPNTMETILNLNGGKKIMSAFASDAFMWNKSQLENLTLRLLPTVSEKSRNDLVLCIENAKCAGIVKLAADKFEGSRNISFSSTSKRGAKLRCFSDILVGSWTDFLRVSRVNQYIDNDSDDDEEPAAAK